MIDHLFVVKDMETSAAANLAEGFGTNVHILKLCLTFWVRELLDVAKWHNSGFVFNLTQSGKDLQDAWHGGQLNAFTWHRLSKHPTLKPYPEDGLAYILYIFWFMSSLHKARCTASTDTLLKCTWLNQLFFLDWKNVLLFYDVKING